MVDLDCQRKIGCFGMLVPQRGLIAGRESGKGLHEGTPTLMELPRGGTPVEKALIGEAACLNGGRQHRPGEYQDWGWGGFPKVDA